MQKKLLSDYIMEDIETMLREGKFKEGDKLPNQNDFAQMLGVSRVSLREALRKLESMGVVQQRPKTGTIILNGNPDTWGDGDKKVELETIDDTMQMLCARKCVESAIARKAAKHITKEQLRKLSKICTDMYEAFQKGDIKRLLSKDKAFHLIIAEACSNKYLHSMYKISLRHEDIFMMQLFTGSPSLLRDLVLSHQAIYEALATNNQDDITTVVQQHSAFLDDIIKDYFAQNESQQGALYFP